MNDEPTEEPTEEEIKEFEEIKEQIERDFYAPSAGRLPCGQKQRAIWSISRPCSWTLRRRKLGLSSIRLRISTLGFPLSMSSSRSIQSISRYDLIGMRSLSSLRGSTKLS